MFHGALRRFRCIIDRGLDSAVQAGFSSLVMSFSWDLNPLMQQVSLRPDTYYFLFKLSIIIARPQLSYVTFT